VSSFAGALTTLFFVAAFLDAALFFVTTCFRTGAFFLVVAAPALANPTANASATQAIRE
jgi:hypothetical protein